MVEGMFLAVSPGDEGGSQEEEVCCFNWKRLEWRLKMGGRR